MVTYSVCQNISVENTRRTVLFPVSKTDGFWESFGADDVSENDFKKSKDYSFSTRTTVQVTHTTWYIISFLVWYYENVLKCVYMMKYTRKQWQYNILTRDFYTSTHMAIGENRWRLVSSPLWGIILLLLLKLPTDFSLTRE